MRPREGWRLPVLAERNARLLLATRMVGQCSDGLLQAALGSFVLFAPERQATAAQVASSFALLLLPYSLVGPFAGVLLDRWSRARVLVVANLGRGVVTLGVAGLVASGRDGLDLGSVVLVALGLGRLVLAGLSAGLPKVVAAEHLVTANALFPTAGTVAAAGGTVTGLLLMSHLGQVTPGRLVVLVAAGLLIAATVASAIPRRALGPERTVGAQPLLNELGVVVRGMVEGWRHVLARTNARRAVVVIMAHRLAFGIVLIDTLLLVRNSLNPSTEAERALADFSLAAGGASFGALAAAIVTPRVAHRIGIMAWAGWTVLVAAPLVPAGMAGQRLGGVVVAASLMGFSGQAVKIACDTILQREISDDFRGRVFALYDVLLNVALVLGMIAVAMSVPQTGVAVPLWISLSALLFATGAWSLRSERPSG
jgi:MFS family permease